MRNKYETLQCVPAILSIMINVETSQFATKRTLNNVYAIISIMIDVETSQLEL